MSDPTPVIGIIGGTGKEGSGLALRWAAAGYTVVIGGRDAEKARGVAAELNGLHGGKDITGSDNRAAALVADIAVLTVPFAAQRETALSLAVELAGKILVDVTVPLVPPKVSRVQLPEGGSAVEALQKALGPDVRIVSAFQNISAHYLKDLSHDLDCDVLVCGDDADACEAVIRLAEAAQLRAFHAGPLVNSVAAEALTSVLIAINQRYKVPASGIRITGLDTAGDRAR